MSNSIMFREVMGMLRKQDNGPGYQLQLRMRELGEQLFKESDALMITLRARLTIILELFPRETVSNNQLFAYCMYLGLDLETVYRLFMDRTAHVRPKSSNRVQIWDDSVPLDAYMEPLPQHGSRVFELKTYIHAARSATLTESWHAPDDATLNNLRLFDRGFMCHLYRQLDERRLLDALLRLESSKTTIQRALMLLGRHSDWSSRVNYKFVPAKTRGVQDAYLLINIAGHGDITIYETDTGELGTVVVSHGLRDCDFHESRQGVVLSLDWVKLVEFLITVYAANKPDTDAV